MSVDPHLASSTAVSFRRLRREADGALYDEDQHRPVTLGELHDDIRAGRRFRAHTSGGETDCTVTVLQELVIGSASGLGPARVKPVSAGIDGVVNVLAGLANHFGDVSGEDRGRGQIGLPGQRVGRRANASDRASRQSWGDRDSR